MTDSSLNWLNELESLFRQNANQSDAKGAAAYMKNQFAFLGIKSPLRRELQRVFFEKACLPDEKQSFEIARKLWEMPEREFQYCAMELLAKHKRKFEENDIRFFEHLITQRSWWDTVDNINSQLLGPWFQQFPHHIIPITKGWNHSDNVWLIRSSLLFQLKYKNKLDKELLSRYILHQHSHPDFFVRKAIGWVLREYAKTNPRWVNDFVSTHRQKLSALSIREALKHLRED
jgi:3-methyladenine DNA glycosylase AlkD